MTTSLGSFPLISHAVITGGTFNQHNSTVISRGGFELLKESVAHAAFHNSGDRPHPPRCHPNTRVAVLGNIMSWILGLDSCNQNTLIMWLNGPAGAGKSAIAQSFCELCSSEGHLLASYFFNRSDPTRNTGKSLFSTIAYQISLALPQVRERISAAVDFDPLLFTKSLSTQYQSLILDPLVPLIDSGFFSKPDTPKVIVVDALDECLDFDTQSLILEAFLDGAQYLRSPLRILICSRPEHIISTAFNSRALDSVHTRLILDNSYRPDLDIELFIRESLTKIRKTHPFRKSIPPDWPSKAILGQLVSKSSGQFIYAATAIEYISSIRHRPIHRLEIVLDIRPPVKDLPFAELDALYTHIMTCVEDIDTVLHVLSFHMLDGNPSLEFIQEILSLDSDDIEILFCDLKSLINLEMDSESDESVQWRLEFYHASLPDFLVDQRRSKRFYVDVTAERASHIQECIHYLLDLSVLDSESTNSEDLLDVYEFLVSNLAQSSPTTGLIDDLRRFPFSSMIYKEIMRDSLDSDKWGCIQYIHTFYLRLVPRFMSSLENLDRSVFEHHLRLFDLLLMEHLDAYYKDDRFTLVIALLRLSSSKRPIISRIPACFTLFDWDSALADIDKRRLCLWDNLVGYKDDYIRLICSSLDAPNRLLEYGLNEERYSSAALCCLKYLCDRSSSSSSRPAKFNRTYIWPESRKRRNTPWIWRRRRVKHREFDEIHIVHRIKTSNGEATVDAKYIFCPFDKKNPVVSPGDWMERYAIGLIYLPKLLAKSGRSNELMEFARRQTFNYRSRKYPEHSRRAWLAINKYLEGAQIDCVVTI